MKESAGPQPSEPVRELLPAHALGATDAAEGAAVRRLVEENAEAAEELAGYAALADALLFAAPPVTPPPALAATLRAAIAPNGHAAAGATSIRQSWQVRIASWFSPPSWAAWGVAVAAVALLVATNLWWGLSMRRMQADAEAMAATEQAKAAMMALMTSDTMEKTTLAGAEQGGAWAELYWDPAQDVALFTAAEFPPLAEDQVYQLWLVRGEERMSGGLFTVDGQGNGTVMVHSPEPLRMFDAVGVTPEPVGGSPGPTHPPIVTGKL